MSYTTTSHDQVHIVAYFLSHNGNKVCDCVIHIFFSRHAKKNSYLPAREQNHKYQPHYLLRRRCPLSNSATANDLDFEWTNLCLEYGADLNTSLVDKYESVIVAVASPKTSTAMVRSSCRTAQNSQEAAPLASRLKMGKWKLMS